MFRAGDARLKIEHRQGSAAHVELVREPSRDHRRSAGQPLGATEPQSEAAVEASQKHRRAVAVARIAAEWSGEQRAATIQIPERGEFGGF